MIKKVLVANRGEIAVRIMRACREMGISTVAIYSEVDKDALHVKLADEAVCVGPAMSKKSYLNVKNILEAACLTGADAVHPGFGFLSENTMFAKMCEEINIKFIGPHYSLIDDMGNKSKAKDTMKNAGVPVIEGSDGIVKDYDDLEKTVKKIGYPVILKASAGGGGKGIRIVEQKEDLKKSFELVKQESKNAFNDDSIYVEKFIKNPRHIEIQIMADEHGTVLHLGERDCSVQRNNQKVIEETLSPVLDEKTREKMCTTTAAAIKKIGYTNVGTVEYLVDSDKNFYFMEMNTRIQVEHPVTECITGIDIVKEQIKIASNLKLKTKQEDIKFKGHSMECRINAENPDKNFRPCPGKITGLHKPGGNGVRVDTAIYAGYTVPGNYDSMIAKLIVHAENRNEAIKKMKSALAEFIIEGIDTNIEFLYRILENKNFIKSNYDTSFIKKEFNL